MRRTWTLTGSAAALTGLLVGALALSGCVPRVPAPIPATAPAPAPSPSPVAPIPAPPPTADWRDAPLTEGDWYYRQEGATTRALFGPPAGEVRFSLTCDRAARQITLARGGVAVGSSSMTITTTSTVRALPAASAGSQSPQLTARLAAQDPLLDAMAFSRGRFAVAVTGLETVYLPSWPEVSRVIEDCR